MNQSDTEAFFLKGNLFLECFPYLEECFEIPSTYLLNKIRLMPPNWKQGDKDIFFNPLRDKSIDENSTILLAIHNYDRLCDIVLESDLKKLEYFNLLMVVNHIYLIQLNIPIASKEELTESEHEILDEYYYEKHIRAEMLELYNFINDWKKTPQNEPITIKWGSKTIKLNNVENWILNAINTHFRFTNLGIESIEEANEELTRYSKKTGRKVANKYQTLIINGIDKLYQKATDSEEITNQQCEFIREYLKYLDIPISDDDFDHDDDIKNIRSRIRYLRKNGCPVKWSENEIQFE